MPELDTYRIYGSVVIVSHKSNEIGIGLALHVALESELQIQFICHFKGKFTWISKIEWNVKKNQNKDFRSNFTCQLYSNGTERENEIKKKLSEMSLESKFIVKITSIIGWADNNRLHLSDLFHFCGWKPIRTHWFRLSK